MIRNKVVGLIIIGHVDGMQHVAGNLLNFFAWLGFQSPEVSIASWVGEDDEDTTKDWGQIQNKDTRRRTWTTWSQVRSVWLPRLRRDPAPA